MFPSAEKLYENAELIFYQVLESQHTAENSNTWFGVSS